jgi:hypothetical protein
MPDLAITGLQPKQKQLLRLIKAKGENVPTRLGFGGSRGAAKSRGVRDDALILAFENPGITIFIIRRNWRDLSENHLEKFKIERPELSKFYSGSRFAYEIPISTPTGMKHSRIAFKYADTTDEVRQLARGPEAAFLFIDQAEQFTEEELNLLFTCCRWPGVAPGFCKVIMTFNPGGPGTEYLRRVFWLKQYLPQEKPQNFAFIQAYGWDNYEWFRGETGISFADFYELDGEVPDCPDEPDEAWLATIPDDNRFKMFVTRTSEGRKMWMQPQAIRMGDLFGRFDRFAGQYFAGVWDERRCTVSKIQLERLIQPWWIRWMSLDWGFRHHAACFWFTAGKVGTKALDEILDIRSDWPLDVVLCYRELVTSNTAEADLGKMIVAATPKVERAQIQDFKAGVDIFAERRGIEHTIAELMENVTLAGGLPRFSRADATPGSRVASARMVYDGFRRASQVRSGLIDEMDKTPVLLIGPDCATLQASIPMLIANPNKLEDVLKLETMQDDVFDGFKYGYGWYRDALERAPASVRRKELFSEMEGDRTEAEMMNLSMAIRKFDASEKRHTMRRRRHR